MPKSSFTTRKLNGSTFVITEDDAYAEHPLIYVKVHPRAQVLIVSDTGCDKASKRKVHEPTESHQSDIALEVDDAVARYTHLRQYLEQCPLQCNDNAPLNPEGQRQYLLIISHCHYDHTLGIPQFLRGGDIQILASSAGRDFIESDLAGHGLYRPIGEPVQPWKVTHWAQAFERLQWPLKSTSKGGKAVGLGITIIQTPGHTPDELAWYDHDEMHLYVGDSFYESGPDEMDIIWPSQGNLVEWHFSMQKLRCFIRSENARACSAMDNYDDGDDGWVNVARRVKVGCGHQTADADGAEILEDLQDVWLRVLRGDIPVVKTEIVLGEIVDRWMEPGGKARFSFRAPRRLMEDAREFFEGTLMART